MHSKSQVGRPWFLYFGMVSLVAFQWMALTGCASKKVVQEEARKSNVAYEQMRKAMQQSDRVAPGNTVHIEYSGDSKVSGDYKVDFDGNVQMPYKVIVKMGGLTISEVKDSVQKAYQAFVKGKTTVSVEIKDRNVWVEVRGEVKNSGRYSVRLDSSLEEIIATAGGFAGEPSAQSARGSSRPDYLRIERPTGAVERESTWFELAEYFLQYDVEPDFLWRGGETLFFQKTAPANADIKKNWHTITVIGEVRDPKEHPVLPNADLLTYVGRSGGPTSAADLSRVEVINRRTDKRLTANLLKDRLTNEIQAGDVIVVRAVDNTPTTASQILTYAMGISSITMTAISVILLIAL